jgi:hypothetical protein
VSISEALEVSPCVFFAATRQHNVFGKSVNLSFAVIESEFMLADIYPNNAVIT